MRDTSSRDGSWLSRLSQTARANPAASFVVLLCAAAAAYLLSAYAFPGEGPRIRAVVRNAATAVEAGDVAALMEYVSPYFSEEEMTRKRLREDLERILPSRPVEHVQLAFRRLEIRGSRAAVRLHATAFHGGTFARRPSTSEWLVTLEHMDGRWMVRSATPDRVNGQRMGGLRALIAIGDWRLRTERAMPDQSALEIVTESPFSQPSSAAALPRFTATSK